MNYKYYIDWLYSLEARPWRFGLERTEALLGRIGNPENSLKFIHVAGTNGKGSTAAMISSVMQHAGYKVGLYTSPHIMDFEERIRVNGSKISRKSTVSLIRRLKRKYSGQTFFEFTTALAFQYFHEEKVDVVVCEVGLGGRLDATNVIVPHCSIITTIDYDHMNLLGSSITDIAQEKAGIIKPGVPVVTIANGIAYQTIRRVASSCHAKVHTVRDNDIMRMRKLELSLRGVHQYENAAIAEKACRLLARNGFHISDDMIVRGLQNTSWPGRMQFLRQNVLVDAAHNPQGVRVLGCELKILRKRYKHVRMVMGATHEKDPALMLKDLEPVIDEFIFTKPTTTRAQDPVLFGNVVKKPHSIIADPAFAVRKALQKTHSRDLLVIGGSIYLLAHAYRELQVPV